MPDLYDTRSVDDCGELLCAIPDYPPVPTRLLLTEQAEATIRNEYTTNLPPAMPETL